MQPVGSWGCGCAGCAVAKPVAVATVSSTCRDLVNLLRWCNRVQVAEDGTSENVDQKVRNPLTPGWKADSSEDDTEMPVERKQIGDDQRSGGGNVLALVYAAAPT